MPLTINELNPYLSVIILKIDDSTFNINSLRTELSTASRYKTDEHSEGGMIYYATYNEEKKVSWLSNNSTTALANKFHHILIVYKYNNYLAIYHSDTSIKNKLFRLMFRSKQPHEFRKLKFIRKEVLNTAFLNNIKVKNLWLSSIHKSSESKADSKVLSGQNLESALDPIGDQYYAYSAIKANSGMLDGDIGINASESKIWMKKFVDSITYFDMLRFILEEIEVVETTVTDLNYNPVSVLANSITKTSILSNMIDVQLESIELFDINSLEYDIINQIEGEWDNLDFTYQHQNNVYVIDVFNNYTNTDLGSFGIIFSDNDSYVDSFVLYSNNSQESHNIQKALENRHVIKYWFANQYMISNGLIYQQAFSNVIFKEFIWSDFSGYTVSKEKPDDNDLTLIGQEDSLFSWVKNTWTGLSPDLSDINQTGLVDGWLLCDDGANEKADFIHITNEVVPTISLIHAKGANSDGNNRRIATTAYEVVVSQAIKNLMYLDKNLLVETIDIAPNHHVQNLVWENGQDSTRQAIKDFLNTVQEYKKRVVILQPHVTKTRFSGTLLTDEAKHRHNQLSALLLSTQNTIQSLGAEFVVIGHNI